MKFDDEGVAADIMDDDEGSRIPVKMFQNNRRNASQTTCFWNGVRVRLVTDSKNQLIISFARMH